MEERFDFDEVILLRGVETDDMRRAGVRYERQGL